MSHDIQIRFYQTDDLLGITALERRVKPYRPEDQTAVEAMFARAEAAERESDPRWMAQPTRNVTNAPESYTAFWVAVQQLAGEGDVVVGTVAAQPFRAGEEMAPTHPLAAEWHALDDVIELRRVRVAPEARGQGIGTQLCQAAIAWAQTQGYRRFVVNTTTPQVPALELYSRLGFEVVGKSFIGKYELVWQELWL